MRSAIKRRIRRALRKFDIGVTRYGVLQKLEQDSRASNVIGLLLEISNEQNEQLLRNSHHSNSQFGQDLFALHETKFKKDGYFVEFGATNGIDLSNTYLLEKMFGWTGILAEPARCWHEELRANRTCQIETDCVWSQSNKELSFQEGDWWEFSGINMPGMARKRSQKSYSVKTISLTDLLDRYNAPGLVDYLSIDTEGSELEILSSFDFEKYRFRTITCEHNLNQIRRDEILALLTSKGYVRKFENISVNDDWYVDPLLISD
jgi:FkbM family methyltransferase